MDFDKKTVLAVVLSLAVILAYQFFLLPKEPPRRPSTTATAPAEPPAPASVPAPASAPPPEAVSPAPQAIDAAMAPPDIETARLLALQESAQPRQIRVATDLYTLVLEGRGGVVSSWRLAEYRDRTGNPLEMVPKLDPGMPPPLAARFADPGLNASFNEGIFVPGSPTEDLILSSSRPEETITLSRVDPSGLLMTRTLTFRQGSYLVDIAVELRNLGTVPRDIPWWLTWGPGLGSEPDPTGRFPVTATSLAGEKTATTKPKKDGDRLPLAPGFRWAGLANQYFLAAFVPLAGRPDGLVQRFGDKALEVQVGPGSSSLPPGGSLAFTGGLYVGPKSFELLSGYDHGLQRAVDFGWSGWLGKPLLEILRFFHRFVGNWGVAIILLTLLVKLCLFPLTVKMYKSMRRMQEIQPLVLALKKKYKDDPQAMNKEMMDLYREHKINPAGGCLPMLVQLPIFLALYKVLTIAIELRGARFLHIRDLSAGETTLGEAIQALMPSFPAGILPLKILVILMGVTMFIQQRLSPTMGDPKQARIMMFLPLVFTAMFWNFTSGLVVYFLFSNILSIGEQALIRKWSAPAAPEPPAKKRT